MRLAPALIFLLALGVRLLYIWNIHGGPLTEVLLIDSETYDRLARLILHGQFHGEEVYAMNVLYPFFLAAVYAVTKAGILGALVVQAVLDAASCVLTWWIGRRLFRPAVGVLAGFAAAVYAPFVFYAGTLLTPTLITLFVLATLALLVRYQDRPRAVTALGAGICLGLAALGRGNNVLFLPAAGALFLVGCEDRTRALRHWATFAVGVFLVVGSVTLRNYLVEQEIVPIAANYAAFYVGHHDKATGIYSMPSFTEGAAFEDEVWGTQKAVSAMLGHPVTLAESSQYLFRLGLQHVVDHPGREFRLALTKLFFFWNRTEAPTNLNIYFARDLSSVLRFLPLAFGLIAPLALTGLFLARREWRRHLALHLMILVYVATAIVFFFAAEYRAPVVPVLLLFAAHAALVLGQGVGVLFRPGPQTAARGKGATPRLGTGRVMVGLLLFTLFAVACNVRTPLLRMQSWKRIDYHNFGILYKNRGDLDRARTMFERSVAIDPRFAPAYASLAEVYLKMGRDIEAARMAEMARRLRPEGEGGHAPGEPGISSEVLRMAELYRAGRYPEALAGFEGLEQRAEAQGDTAASLSILNNIGLCHFKLGALHRAAEVFLAIVKKNSRYVKAYNNLGMVREAQGRGAEAVVEYTKALALDPGNTVASRALDRLHASSR